MDFFSTGLEIAQVIYDTTIFIKEVVAEYKGYDDNKRDITEQLEHELVFVETFQEVCFTQDAPLLKSEKISESIKRDVNHSLVALGKALAEYRIEAARYALATERQEMIDGVKKLQVTEDTGAKRSFRDQIKAKYKKGKESVTTLRWALFGKEEILELLEGYKIWTSRLRETFQLITGIHTLMISASVSGMAVENLGVAKARERQIRAIKPPGTDYGPLDGSASDVKQRSENEPLTVAVYESDDGFDSTEVILDVRPYDDALLRAIEARNLEEIQALKEPLRSLSWLLQSPVDSSSSERDIENDYGLHTLSCIGYLDQAEKERGLLLYRFPSGQSSEKEIHSLHALIEKDARTAKPGLGSRYRIARSLAATIFATHSSGWVHKNVCSRGILMLPNQTNNSEYDPYLLGWGTSRPIEAGTTLQGVFELEPNLYHHKDRFGQPNTKFSREHDIYSLGVVLLELGLWKTMSSIFAKQIQKRPKMDVKDQASTFQKVNGYMSDKVKSLELRQEMGATYAEVVRRCLTWPSVQSEEDAGDLAIDFRKQVVDTLVLGCKL